MNDAKICIRLYCSRGRLPSKRRLSRGVGSIDWKVSISMLISGGSGHFLKHLGAEKSLLWNGPGWPWTMTSEIGFSAARGGNGHGVINLEPISYRQCMGTVIETDQNWPLRDGTEIVVVYLVGRGKTRSNLGPCAPESSHSPFNRVLLCG